MSDAASSGRSRPDETESPRASRSWLDRMLEGFGYASLLVMLLATVAWWPLVSRLVRVVDPAWLWRVFAAAVVVLWVVGFVRVVHHLARRRRLAAELLERRRALINNGQEADREYLAAREFVLGPSPFVWLTTQLGASSLLSLIFMAFIHRPLGQGWVRGVIAVAILTVLAVPISWLASKLDAKIARSDHALTLDI